MFEEINKSSDDWRELLRLIDHLRTTRANLSYHPPEEGTDISRFKAIQDSEQALYELLCQEARFRKDAEFKLFDLGKGRTTVAKMM